MANVGKAQRHALGHGDGLAVGARAQLRKHALGVGQRVQRLRLGPPGPARLARFPLGLALLNMGAVAQHNLAQVAGGFCGIHRAPKAVFVQKRQVAGMVDVRVRQHHKIQLAGGQGQRRVFKGVRALLHAAIHQEIAPAHLHQRAAACHLVRGAKKRHLHAITPIGRPAGRLFLLL